MDLIVPNWHPILVHFTIGLLAVAAGLSVVAVFIRDTDARSRVTLVAEWNFWIGAVITVLTLLAGWRAFNTVAHDGPAHRMMLDHRTWALVTAGWVLLMGVWLLFYKHFARKAFNALFAAAAVVLLGLLGTTAWHGGELVYRHGLGVMSLPDTGRHEHSGHRHAGDPSARASEERSMPRHESHAGPRDDAGASDNESSTLHDDHDHHDH